MFLILTVLVVIASILLVGVILLQNGKGDGLASNFVAGNQAFGVRQTANILEKITWGLISVIIFFSIIGFFSISSKGGASSVTKEIEKTVTESPAFPSAPIHKEEPSESVPAK